MSDESENKSNQPSTWFDDVDELNRRLGIVRDEILALIGGPIRRLLAWARLI